MHFRKKDFEQQSPTWSQQLELLVKSQKEIWNKKNRNDLKGAKLYYRDHNTLLYVLTWTLESYFQEQDFQTAYVKQKWQLSFKMLFFSEKGL